MKKVGIVTVHAAHNYGSCLQAYALQKKIEEMHNDCYILNLRLPIQKEIYNVFTKRISLKYFLKNLYVLFFIHKDRKMKHEKFEDFIAKDMKLSEEVNTIDEFTKIADSYDCVIAGSDQIWCLGIAEFTNAYLLANIHSKKVAYAVSCGDSKVSDFSSQQKEYIKEIDDISVRDEAAAELVMNVTGERPKIVLDPTMLYDSEFYDNLCGSERLIKEKYIYLYTIGNSKELLEIAKKLSKKTGLPVYISNVSGTHYMFGTKKKIATGPREFLNHIRNAEYIITSSFHGTVFSILYEKQFWTFEAENDARKKELLGQMDMLDRGINLENCENKFDEFISEEKYRIAKNNLLRLREKSIEFLHNALS